MLASVQYIDKACEVGRRSNVLRSVWCAVASGTAELRTLRQDRAWTHRAAAQPRSRTCAAGGHFVDGVLGAARGWRSCLDHCRAGHLRPRVSYFQWWPTARSLGLAAAPAHGHRMAAAGKIRGRFLRGLGFVAARGLGTYDRAGRRFRRVVERPTRYGARRLHALGAAAQAVR